MQSALKLVIIAVIGGILNCRNFSSGSVYLKVYQLYFISKALGFSKIAFGDFEPQHSGIKVKLHFLSHLEKVVMRSLMIVTIYIFAEIYIYTCHVIFYTLTWS